MIEYDVMKKFRSGKSISAIVQDIQRMEYDFRTKRSKHSYKETKEMVENIIKNNLKVMK